MGWTHDRARVAALTRHRKPTDPELVEARRSFIVDQLTEHVRRVVAAAPPLSLEQRDTIAALLRSAGGPRQAPGTETKPQSPPLPANQPGTGERNPRRVPSARATAGEPERTDTQSQLAGLFLTLERYLTGTETQA